jgi:hypothetical protein
MWYIALMRSCAENVATRTAGWKTLVPNAILWKSCCAFVRHQEKATVTRTLNDLNPLPYHLAIREYLLRDEPEVWNWFASHRVRQEQIDAVRFDLLKATYRIDRESKPEWYEAAEQVAADLALDVPVTIYQAQEPVGLNASLAFVPGEAHIVLHGPVASTLAAVEFRALLAHELGHLMLWQIWDGDFLTVDQLLSALTHDPRAETAHFATARLFALYNEIFCDRASLLATGGLLPAVAMLIKVSTGLPDVSAESYLRQADEVFSRGAAKAADLTHPEAFIRARALRLWSEGDPDADRKNQRDDRGRTGVGLPGSGHPAERRRLDAPRDRCDARLAVDALRVGAGPLSAVLRRLRSARCTDRGRRPGPGDRHGRCGHAGLLLFHPARSGHGGPRSGRDAAGRRAGFDRASGTEGAFPGKRPAGIAAAQAAA